MKKISSFLLMVGFVNIAIAQNVGIGNTTPNASAILDVSSTTKGMLAPRMSTAQRNAIVSPARGLTIFNTDDNCTDIFDGAAWIKNCGVKQTGTATMNDNNWMQQADVPATSYGKAAAFSIGAKGYVIADNGSLFEYEPVAGSWVQKAAFPGGIRYRAVAFSIGTKGYFGTGTAGDVLKDDFWEYDPSTNTWVQKANFPGGVRKYAVGFSVGTKGYLGTGEDAANYKNDLWEYDPVFNAWTQKANLPADSRSWAMGMSIGSKGYIGGGITLASAYGTVDFWEYNPSLNIWTQRANIGATPRSMGVAFSIGNKGYVGTGTFYSFQNDFLEYDPATNTWTQKASFPAGGRFRCIGFSVGTMGYIGGGDNLSSFYNDFWEYNTTPVSVPAYSSAATPVAAVVTDGAWTRAGSLIYNTLGGNVGIGTSNPSNKLSIGGDADITGKFGIGTAQPSNQLSVTGDADVTGKFGIGTALPNNKLSVTGNADISGNVGIGTIQPAYPLNFSTNTGDKISLYGNSAGAAHYGFGIQGGLLQMYSDAAAADIAFGYGRSSAFTERMRIKGNGNVGIGDANPGYLLTINGTDQAIMRINGGTGMYVTLAENNINRGYIGSFEGNPEDIQLGTHSQNATGSVHLSTLNVPRLTVSPAGNIGIGNTSPTRPLSFSPSLGEKIVFYPGGVGEVGIGVYGGELRLHCDIPGGKVSFGTQDNAGNFDQTALAQRNGVYAFSVVGSLWVNGTTYASDERFKKNITAIASPLEKLLQLNGVEYEMRTEAFPGNHFTPGRQIGLIAQNVEKIIPDAVNEKDGYKGVDYARLVPLLIESIKELKKEIDALKAQVNH